MGYVSTDGKWSKKGSVKVKVKVEQPKMAKFSVDSVDELKKDVGEIKGKLMALEDEMYIMQDKMDKLFHLLENTCIDVGKLRISLDGLQKDGIMIVNKLIESTPSSMEPTHPRLTLY